jgi:hypothetical protein
MPYPFRLYLLMLTTTLGTLFLLLPNAMAQSFAARPPLDTQAIQLAGLLLQDRLKTARHNEQLTVNILTSDAYALQQQLESSFLLQAKTLRSLPGLVTISLVPGEIEAIKSWNLVNHISLASTATEETKNEGYDFSLSGITVLHHRWPSLRGNGMTISIKERAFDHDDIDLQGRAVWSAVYPMQTSQHATRMISLAAGAPNSDPYALGVAPGAFITASDFSTLTPDPDSIFEQLEINVQNHSYGSAAPQNYYGPEAMAYDASAIRLPDVLHVFSAGNEGGDAAPGGQSYAGIIGYANISGTYKQSKNTIAVGAVDSFRNVYLYSSAGPTYDGRIKPELVTYSRDGTSGAAAIVSGTALLLQQAFLQANGWLPDAALIRAALINTAEDIGNVGPDYKSGFGLVRAHHAMQLIEEERYVIDFLQVGEQLERNITVSPGMHDLRVTLSWSDPAAETFAAQALVNDLDLELIRVSDGQVFRPFVLNHAMHRDSIRQVALTGIDTINNNEHILIPTPAPGEYRIRVAGKSILGTQVFAVAWSGDVADQFTWIYPTASDVPEAGRRTGVRWETNIDTDGVLEYKWVEQSKWDMLASVLTKNQYTPWTWPDSSGLMQVRFRAGPDTFVSDTFLVSSQLQMKAAYVCDDSSLVYWSAVQGASAYKVLQLGTSQLNQLAIVTDTTYRINDGFFEQYLAVAPVFDERVGRTSPAIQYRSQGVSCYINYFFLHHVEDSIAILQADISWLDGVKSLQLERLINGVYHIEKVVEPVTSFITLISSAPLDQGRNIFRLVVQFDDGRSIASTDRYVYYAGEHDMIIFPNPPTGESAIRVFVKRQDVFDMAVYDMMGRLLYEQPLASNPEIIPTQNLPAGMYVIAARFEDGEVVTERFLIIN